MTLFDFFKENSRIALAFSGGVDSTYLLYEAMKYVKKVRAYYVKTAFQPQFELDDALRIAKYLNADMEIIEIDILRTPEIVSNPKNRCYHCKKQIFSSILKKAKEEGFDLIVDGTNASDDASDRPGMIALRELSVRSPLRECGITKEEIRRLSKEAGLFTWNKPAYACLATRISTGELITIEKLKRTEKAEAFLASIGFSDFRIRMIGDSAKLQIIDADFLKLFENRQRILSELKKYYDFVLLDLEERI